LVAAVVGNSNIVVDDGSRVVVAGCYKFEGDGGGGGEIGGWRWRVWLMVVGLVDGCGR